MRKPVTDRRFAILIGINDYDRNPLRFCVNDARAVATILEERCGFKREDIFTITSEKGATTKDISGHLAGALRKLQAELRAGEDSVFFYFAGHGTYQSRRSSLAFHDSLVEIESVFNQINELQPKYQFYVIDACESGGRILERSSSDNSIIERFISKSSGILFMYATTESESATENGQMEHGLFTYYFLSAIANDRLYDDYGILTPNRIQDYIAQKTSEESRFEQTPVLENRTTGYYPFAFTTAVVNAQEVTLSAIAETVVEQTETSRSTPEMQSAIDKLYFPSIPSEIRQQVLAELRPVLGELVVSASNDLDLEGYDFIHGETTSIFHHTIEDKLTASIVEKSRIEHTEAVSNLFSSERRENKPNLLNAKSFIDAFISSNQPQYTYFNNIHWYSDELIAHSFSLKSNDIHKVSCGLVIIVYQAVFGLGLACSSFYMDYTGYSDTQVNGPYTLIKGYKIHDKTIFKIKQAIEEQVAKFSSQIAKWNTLRQKAIDAFGAKSE